MSDERRLALKPVLIIGAGPVGLAAALFLTRRGVPVRIVDADTAPSETSRALGINPRTLALLSDTGVTAAILAEAQPIRALSLHHHGQPLAKIALNAAALGADHPMVILPQARSEAHLTEALSALGVRVERGRAVASLAQDATAASAVMTDGEVIDAPVVFAADGAHSVARHALGIDFSGDGWPEPWHLMDVDLDGPPADEGWIDFQPDGGFICLPFSGRMFRLFSFGRPLLERVPADWRVGAVHWQSEFKVSHRIASRLSSGRIALGGDAAHIHSPVGARGMNLGIEDAYVFAACCADFLNGETGRLEDYHRLRHPVDAAVVRNVRTLTSFVRNTGPLADLAKRTLPPIAARLPFVINRALRVGMGLDHPVRLR
jgi:hypothetical protein